MEERELDCNANDESRRENSATFTRLVEVPYWAVVQDQDLKDELVSDPMDVAETELTMDIKAFTLASLLPIAVPAFGHHSFAMFELTKDVTYEGTVVEYRWENPHTHIIVKVDQGAGDPTTVGTWDVEGGATNIMGCQGWTRASFKPGDHIKVVAHPMKDGSKGASLFYAVLPDGKRLYHDIARPKSDGGGSSGNPQ